MALAWTQQTLEQALRDWPVEHDNDDYEDNIENLISLGELRLIRDLNLDTFDVVDETLTLDEGSRFVTKPTTLITTRSLRIGKVISAAVEAAADDDSICTAQAAEEDLAELTINGAAAIAGVVTFTVARAVTVKETTESGGGIQVVITGTDKNSFTASERVTTKGGGETVFTRTLFLTITTVEARFGDGVRPVKVGGAVAVGVVVIGETWPLEKRSKDFCQDYAPDRRELGRPVYYNEHSATQWEVVDAADQDYAVIAHHVARPTGLNDGLPDASTWLSRSVPDALFAACLMEAEHLLKADDRYADYKTKYEQELLPAARLELRNQIRVGDRGPFMPTMSAAG